MENNKMILSGNLTESRQSHSEIFLECSKENGQIISDILKLLKGKNVILGKEILKACLEEIDYTSTVN